MSKFIGRLIQVGIGKESVRGTVVAPTFWLQNTNADIEDKFEGVVDENTIGVIEDASDFKVTKKHAEGEIPGKVGDSSFGLLLLAALGSVSSEETADTGVYEHTYSVQQGAQHDSLTVEVKNPNEQKAHANAVITSLSIKAALGKFVEFTVGIMAKLGVTASNTPSYVAENPFIAKDINIKIADYTGGLDGASAICAKDLEINIEKNIDSDDCLGDVEPSDFLNKQFAVSGSVELTFDDTTYKALALAGAQKAMRVELINGDVTIGASSNPSLVIDLAKVKFTEWAKTSGQNEVVKQTLQFKGFYSITDTKMISAVLTNTNASY